MNVDPLKSTDCTYVPCVKMIVSVVTPRSSSAAAAHWTAVCPRVHPTLPGVALVLSQSPPLWFEAPPPVDIVCRRLPFALAVGTVPFAIENPATTQLLASCAVTLMDGPAVVFWAVAARPTAPTPEY